MSLAVKVAYAKGQFEQVFKGKYQPIAAAVSEAVAEVGAAALDGGRRSIADAGPRFGIKWQRALQFKLYPQGRDSAHAAGLLYLKSSYGGIFEHGGVIEGKPYLWIPLSSSPKTSGGKKLTPQVFEKTIGPLFEVKRLGKPPLLVAKIDRVSHHRDSHGGAIGAVTLAALKRGASLTKHYSTVPIFVGVKSVHITPKFHIRAAADIAIAGLPAAFYRAFKDN